MVKIIVVDDEKLFRDYVKTAVKWKEYGMEIIGEASNGEEAWHLIQEEKPDILLLDINMPKLNGLELLDRIHQHHKEMTTIIITGHDKFEYAREALRYGVKDYLIKPFDIEELLLTLLKIKDNFKRASSELKLLKNQRHRLRNFLLNRYLTNSYRGNDRDFLEELRELNMPLRLNHLMVTAIVMDHMDEKWDEVADRNLWGFAVKNMLDELMEPLGKHYSFHNEMGWVISIIDYEDITELDVDLRLYQQLQKLIYQYLNFTVTIGYSDLQIGLEGLRKGFTEAKIGVSKGILQGGNKFLQGCEQEGALQFYSSDIYNDIIKALRVRDEKGLMEKINEVYQNIRVEQVDMDNIRMMSLSLISMGVSHVIQHLGTVEPVFEQDIKSYTQLTHHISIVDQQKLVEGFFTKIIDYYVSHEQSREGIIAKKALDFIQAHYHEGDLAIGTVARALYINQSYLRSMFKQEIGMTINEYITNMRMEEAKKLIIQGQIKLTEIGNMVGYNDPGYFSRRFKQYVGISPRQFEVQHLQA